MRVPDVPVVHPAAVTIPGEPRSPRVAALRRELSAGSPDALGAFWREVEAGETPLVEEIDGDEGHRLVTFLWRGDDATRAVAVIDCYLAHPNWDPQNRVLFRLDETDVWHKTNRVRADARASYRLSPNNPGVLGLSATQEEREASWLVDPLNRHPWHRPRNPEDYTDGRQRPPYSTVSTVTLPAAPARPQIESRPGVPTGRLAEHRIRSALLGSDRRVWIYVAPDYAVGAPRRHAAARASHSH